MISSRLNKNNPLIFQVVLTVIYLVGMIGFSNPEWKEELQPTSGVILYISTFIMALASKNKLKFMVFMSIAFIGVYPVHTIFLIIIPWWIYKVVMGVFYTPLSYLGIYILRKYGNKSD